MKKKIRPHILAEFSGLLYEGKYLINHCRKSPNENIFFPSQKYERMSQTVHAVLSVGSLYGWCYHSQGVFAILILASDIFTFFNCKKL